MVPEFPKSESSRALVYRETPGSHLRLTESESQEGPEKWQLNKLPQVSLQPPAV